MAMKFLDLGRAKFKWEWRLEWEESSKDNFRDTVMVGWEQKWLTFKNRAVMRRFKGFLQDAEWTRNVVVKRRLVQVNWEDYNDSFTWNRGCGTK
jgi:hypothetical protein